MKIDFSQYLLDGIKKYYIPPIVSKEFDYLTSHFKDFAEYLNSTFNTDTFNFYFGNYYTYDKSNNSYYYSGNIQLKDRELVVFSINSNIMLTNDSIDKFICKTFKIKEKPTISTTSGSVHVILSVNHLFNFDQMEASLVHYLQNKYPDELNKLTVFL